MATRIRVVIADDSAVTRKILTAAISLDLDLELVAAGQNGEEAVSLCRTQKPDVMLLDVEMPVMTGIAALQSIRTFNQQIPVIMFSTLTVRGGEATLDALQAGATDFVPKPTGVGHLDKAIAYLQTEVIPKLKMWGRRSQTAREKIGPGQPPRMAVAFPSAARTTKAPAVPAAVNPGEDLVMPAQQQTSPLAVRMTAGENALLIERPQVQNGEKPRVHAPRRCASPVTVLGIGSSTGGPNALAEVISRLPADLNIPVLITQHMPPIFTQLLAERLDRTSRLTVREAFDGAVVKAGDVWIAPGDYHMTVVREGTSVVIRTSQGPPENSCRPAVDVMFRSLAQVYGAGTLALVLTGMGRDGTAGCQQLRQTGAGIIVQDETSSVVWGMPRSVADAGLADAVIPLSEMHSAVMTRVCASMATSKVSC